MIGKEGWELRKQAAFSLALGLSLLFLSGIVIAECTSEDCDGCDPGEDTGTSGNMCCYHSGTCENISGTCNCSYSKDCEKPDCSSYCGEEVWYENGTTSCESGGYTDCDYDSVDCGSKTGCDGGTYYDYDCEESEDGCYVDWSSWKDSDNDGYDDECDDYDNDPCSQTYPRGDNCGDWECNEEGEGTYCDNCNHCTDGTVNCDEDCENDYDCCDGGQCPAEESCVNASKDYCDGNKLVEWVLEDDSPCDDLSYCDGPEVVKGGTEDGVKNQIYVYDSDKANCNGCDCYSPKVVCDDVVNTTEGKCVRGVCGAECEEDSDCVGNLECEDDCQCEEEDDPFISFDPVDKGWSQNVTVEVDLEDHGSGLVGYQYRWCRSENEHCGFAPWKNRNGLSLISFSTDPGDSDVVSPEGELYLWVRAKDATGRITRESSGPYKMDKSGPCFLKLEEEHPFGSDVTWDNFNTTEPDDSIDDKTHGSKSGWISFIEVGILSQDPYRLSGMDRVEYFWDNHHRLPPDSINETFFASSPVDNSTNITTSGNWSLVVSSFDNAERRKSFTLSTYPIDTEDPYVDIYHNTTPGGRSGSQSVTKNRNVTFTVEASDSYSGVRRIEMYVVGRNQSGDITSFYNNNWTFNDDPVEGSTITRSLTTDEPFEPLEFVKYNATVWDATNQTGEKHSGNMNTTSKNFTACGFNGSSMKIGNDLIENATCADPSNNTRIEAEDCGDYQKAGMAINATGSCPPLLFVINASSEFNESVEENISDELIHPHAMDPVIKGCEAFPGASGDNRTDGIYTNDTQLPPDDEWGLANATWNVSDIPYYCRGEVLEGDNYSIYENLEDENPRLGGDKTKLLVEGDGENISGNITFEPTIKKMEYWVTEESNIKTGINEYVFPMNVTNWNDRPIAVKISWKPFDDLFRFWGHRFTRNFDVPGYRANNTSYDDIESYGSVHGSYDYGYERLPLVESFDDNRDIQLVLGGRNQTEKRKERFALVVRSPPWAKPGPYFTDVRMTRNESMMNGA